MTNGASRHQDDSKHMIHCLIHVQLTSTSWADLPTNSSCSPITMHLRIVLLLGCLIALSAERINAPVTTRDIMRIIIVEVPAQAPKEVLAGLEQDIHFVAEALLQMVDILLHVPGRVAGCNDGALCLEEQRERLLPLVHAGCVAEARVEDDEAVKVRVVRVKVARLVDGVVVLDKSADLHGVADAVFDDGAKGVEWGALG